MDLPLPDDLAAHPRDLLAGLEAAVGAETAAQWCADLLLGADPHEHAAMLPYVGGRAADAVLSGSWKPYWARAWGARGLLYVWSDSVAGAVVAGIADEHWRPAEMAMKAATVHELGEAGPAALPWLDAELPRVRAVACRLLGVVGDTEHVDAVAACLDDPDPAVRKAAARALGVLRRRLDLPDDDY